ncbi:actin family [Thamnocephalis sphaerospora]|uniref:Actin family n=1 Tax=Thamnocephalis sphaerospora TaxID=78915 RepID=A0A4P9XQD0_9FUNG|nr:actin family [Thamnocephalis sphaerospora]|eukprot:RKP08237.1 actin family [Thamnocephalis sphaerospora]
MATFGGDEVSALVLDVGAGWTKAGYAGEDAPAALFSSWVGAVTDEASEEASATAAAPAAGAEVEMKDASVSDATAAAKTASSNTKYYVNDGGAAPLWRERMEMRAPIKDGIIEDWDTLEQLWDHAFYSSLRVNPTEHPLLVSESAWNTRDVRERLAELAFEKYRVPAFFVCKDAVLTAFSAGRPTALVVDSGAGSTRVVPVYDGYVLRKNVVKQSLAGHQLSEIILNQMESDMGINVVPQYRVKSKTAVDVEQAAKAVLHDRPNTTDSYDRLAKLRVVDEYKESVCQVFETMWDDASAATRPMKAFEFPNGYNRFFGVERLRAPEMLFQPEKFLPPWVPKRDIYRGIPGLIYTSVSGCDVDLRPHLLNNIVVAGGNTLLPGFVDRLNQELSLMAPSTKIRVHAPASSTERRCSSWLGGSILASLGTFHQMWISRKEFEENGAQIVDKKCQ